MDALGSRTIPPVTSIGVSYMLAGGATSNIDDPFFELPFDSDAWILDPPHIMLYFPLGMLDKSEIPTDPAKGGPWRMWAGTPYVHIMIPTAPAGSGAAADLDPTSGEWMSQNALSAGPEVVVRDATVIGWAAGRGSEPIVLREGDDEVEHGRGENSRVASSRELSSLCSGWPIDRVSGA